MAGISYILVNGNDPTQMAESLRWARRAIASNPESAKAQFALASVYMATGEFSKSRAAFRNRIGGFGRRVGGHHVHARRCGSGGNLDAAGIRSRVARVDR